MALQTEQFNANILRNGEWVESRTGERISISAPASGVALGSIPALSQEEVNDAIQGAKDAQKIWKIRPIHERVDLLYAWADLLEERKEIIGELIMHEVAKPKKSAIGEVSRTADIIRHTADEALRLNGETLKGDQFKGGSSKKIALVEREPLGVVLAISPFNYPVNLAAAKIAPALVTGNTVVFKPATQGSLSGIKMVEALADAGAPEGIIQVVTGRGSVIGDHLVEHPGIDMITFTGGTTTGERISEKAKMIPVVLELGGKDPAIVLDDADLKLTASQIVSGAFSYSGQRCTAIKRVFVQDSVADQLVANIKELVEQLTVGSPEDDADITPVIDEKSAAFIQGLIDDALENGATLLSGNKRQGNLLSPTLLDDVTPAMRVAWEEPFGPVLPIIRVKDANEAISLSNQSDYGLQASIFTKDTDRAINIGKHLEVGTVHINAKTERGPDHFPFLGVKKSGLGVQGIKPSLLSMTRERVTVLNL
ncbi:NADP-dependent glyceraldehyde-3-phosphate dehydrogenase [Halalkalibacterium halodurans]|uniref:NADP-dependent glyceraldehyde-3-phosphate dehydrogenase n=2 Tax=Halalkalibacterium halodurans TaxID=86665 RepID=Q9KAQ0_HALH5|nr:NADP-dependent glyceraldehyde-3-phosphate dehydrogenase [Halalkalibacterium halodurans]MDY7222789.1 NADP-dependent glyceraldehyde-3-phosphate dehydrogenase [Halalkalibacterium halodurans]MDY7242010.1 NADP-dependent glyceraldehyde-3-phosphate dehydrogenase [Halalkalibacterium halodurans]MED4080979.1 NADP-dependent glyceraldehyde-3-phosphate dehydrogenase [Halalkalibacterium halodurans]MED4085162.1 NADP-dependent glyceraldehyde-3-phosphate dehydrogenase [Halalkalibacterium halodurans]MED41052